MSSLTELFQQQPGVGTKYQHFLGCIDQSGAVAEQFLAAAALRVAAVHGVAIEQVTQSDFRAALPAKLVTQISTGEIDALEEPFAVVVALADQLPFAHHSIDDALVEKLHTQFGAKGSVVLLTAIAFYDVTARQCLVMGYSEVGNV